MRLDAVVVDLLAMVGVGWVLWYFRVLGRR